MTWKFRVTVSSGEEFVVRFYPPGREHVLNYEPDVLRRCAEAGVPVPEVKIDSRTGPQAPRPYIMYRRIKGETLLDRWPSTSAPTRRSIATQLIEHIYKLNTIPVEGFGELITATQAHNKSWIGFLHKSLVEGLDVARQHSTLSPDLIVNVGIILDHLDNLRLPSDGGLVWGDVSPANVIVNENDQVAGLIDFEGALGGDVALNLGYCFAGYYPSGFYEAVLAGWPETITQELLLRIELYAVVRGMRIAKYAHKSLPGGKSRIPVEEFLPGFASAATRLCGKFRSETSRRIT